MEVGKKQVSTSALKSEFAALWAPVLAATRQRGEEQGSVITVEEDFISSEGSMGVFSSDVPPGGSCSLY